jgi:HAE1 family hydrophobic/amphiphilic exporter-1
MEAPAGNVEDDRAIYSVRLMAKFTSLNELRNTVIATSPSGGTIKVMDVAEVEDGTTAQRQINRIDHRDAIGISIQKQSDANTVNVADLVKAELAAMEHEYEDQLLRFEIASDDSVFTRAAANGVVTDLMLAVLIVSIMCFVFLHNARAAAIIMISVPLAIVPAFIVMFVLDLSLNMMSLLALSLVVGLLVDDSIVMIENMSRHMEEGKSRREAALDGAKQIVVTCVSMTLVIVVVFAPLAIAGGLIGNILKEFSIPIIAAILFSLLGTFTLTPLLMSRFGKLSDNTKNTFSARFSRAVDRAFDGLKNAYVQILEFSLRHKISVLLASLVLFVASLALFPAGLIGFTFIPERDEGELIVNIDMNPQVTVYQNNQTTRRVEHIISQYPEVERIYTNIGSAGGSVKNNATTINVRLADRSERTIETQDFAQILKADLMQIPGIRVRVQAGGGRDPIQFIIQGTDFEQVQATAAEVLDVVRRTAGVVDARYSIDDPRHEIQVRLDRDKVATLGLSVTDVASTLRVALNGNDEARYSEGDFEYRIRVGVDNFNRTNAEDVSLLTVLNRQGRLIELKQFADITYGLGPTALERTDRVPSIVVSSGVAGRPAGTVGSEITEQIKDIAPQGITVRQGGTMEMQSTAFGSLAITFLVALVLIYLILVVLYNSLTDPAIVLFSVPLSLIGAFLALALTMNTLNIFSIIGLIVLIGVVSKNAILLVDFTNEARATGMDTYDALIASGKERLRPILMTTVSTVCAMLPIALATGNGAETKTGMAWVIVGGLTSSMLLTLIVIPVVYYIFDRLPTHIRRKRMIRKQQIRRVKDVLKRAWATE